MDGQVDGLPMPHDHLMKTIEEAGGTGFLIHEEHGSWRARPAKPIQARGDANSQIEG